MKLVVVGGQSRNLGKTALICEIVRALAECRWTAVKITHCEEGICAVQGESCGCAPNEHQFAIEEERDRAGRGDSSRFLAAGARRSLWVRVKQGQLAAAWPALRGEIAKAGHAIVESNSVLEFVEPDLYLVVLDYSTRDFKASARQFLGRADAIVLREPGGSVPASEGALRELIAQKPTFLLPPGKLSSPELLNLVRGRVLSPSAV